MHIKTHIALAALVASAAFGGQARADQIVAWGDNTYGQVSNVPAGHDFTAIAAGDGPSAPGSPRLP